MKRIRVESRWRERWDEKDVSVYDFSASWHSSCRIIEPSLKRLGKERPDGALSEQDSDKQDGRTRTNEVRGAPKTLFMRKGEALKRITGIKSCKELSKQAKKLLAPGTA